MIVKIAYKLKGIVDENIFIGLSTPASCMVDMIDAAQLETGAIIQIGAAVESIR